MLVKEKTKYKNLALAIQEGIGTITIMRASKHNAINTETMEEIRQVMFEVIRHPDIKSVIITGEGTKAFVAGADIAELVELDELGAKRYSQNGQDVYGMIENCPKPVIAAINGYALGGGCELALACHMRVAVENAKFGLPEVRLGTIPGFGGTQRLTQSIGKAKTLELIMTGDMLSARDAFDLGLINHIVTSHEELIRKSREILKKIASSGPVAVAMVIKSVNEVYSTFEAGYMKEATHFGQTANTSDYHEGMKAFLEKREAHFEGK